MDDTIKKQFNVAVDEDNMIHLVLGNIVEAENLSKLERWADLVKKTIQDTYNSTSGKVKVLVDTSEIEKYDSKAISIITDLMRVNSPYVGKTATFGARNFIALAQEVVGALAERDNFRVFEEKQEALDWLHSKEI